MSGKHPIETKVKVASMLSEGIPYAQIEAETGLAHSTIWKWMTRDPEFQAIRSKMTDAVVNAQVSYLRALSRKAVESLERGLDSPEDGLAVKAADLTLKRIGEFAEQQRLNVSGSLLESWMGELDGERDPDHAASA